PPPALTEFSTLSLHDALPIYASALMMGLLSRKGPPQWHPAPAPFKETCRQAVDYCRQHGADIEVLALQRVLQDDRIPSTLVGMKDRKSTRLNSSHQIISYAVF